ncbi:hypothetical protein BC831DRAFT_444783 [Entophlyctis helioformis]|nr:hypothetical protein BC831DRAFT_444783 [Entophlyctis helioformis]
MSLKVAAVALGMSSFVGTHLVMSHPPVRKDLVEKLGADRFKGLYSLVSVVTLGSTALFYARYGKSSGPQLYKANSLWQRAGGLGFKALGAVTFSQALIQPSAIRDTAMRGPGSTPTEDEINPQGIYRVSRHSTFMAFAFLGLGNLLTRGFLSDIIFWGTFPAFWVVGSIHQDERLKATFPAKYFEQTSLLPGQAMIEGKQTWKQALSEMNPKVAAVALLAPIFFL